MKELLRHLKPTTRHQQGHDTRESNRAAMTLRHVTQSLMLDSTVTLVEPAQGALKCLS